MTCCEDNFIHFLLLDDEGHGSLQELIMMGDYSKRRDILDLVREAYEAGWDARGDTDES